jgi:hypothetical protein
LLSTYQISKQASRLVTQLWTWKQPHCALLNPEAHESTFVVQFQICEKNSKAVLNLQADLLCCCASVRRILKQFWICKKNSLFSFESVRRILIQFWICEKNSSAVLNWWEVFLCSSESASSDLLCSCESARRILIQFWICKLRLVVQYWDLQAETCSECAKHESSRNKCRGAEFACT